MKKLFISLMLVSAVVGMNTAMAVEDKTPAPVAEQAVQKPMAKPNPEIVHPTTFHKIGEVPPSARYFGPGPQVDKNHTIKMNTPKHFDKAAMEAKKAEIDKRLKLTDEQRKKIEENKIKDREQLTPIIEQIKVKKQEIRAVIENPKLSDTDKSKKTAELLKELDGLKLKADNIRKENLKNFESILTEKQKKEFEKIKKEQKKEIEKLKKQHEKRRKNLKDVKKKVNPPVGCPVQPKPLPDKK